MRKLYVAALLLGCAFSQNTFAQDAAIPAQTLNEELRARLPEATIKSGKMVAANSGSFPPYQLVEGTKMTGATADLSTALGQLLGVEIQHASVGGLPAMLSGISAGRFDYGSGPIGDFPSRQEANDFIDWVREYVVFAVKGGNPEGISSLDTACGKRVAVMAGGSAEKVIVDQSAKCEAEAKKAIEIQSYADQPTSILAVRSNRADAFFSSQAPLVYYVQQANGQLELSAVGQQNGFDDLFQGAVAPKDSPLSPILRDGIQILIDNGTYDIIMDKWGLKDNKIEAAGINIAGKGK